jgi:hypothetical protein
MLIQLPAKLAVVCFVTVTFELGATVTHAIFLGTLLGVLAFDSFSESLEIYDVAHDDSKPPLPSALPPGSRLKVRDDRNHLFRVLHQTCNTIIAAPFQTLGRQQLQYVVRNTIQRHIFVIYTMIPATARELA